MEILIGLVLAAVVLYFWLIGHWFARVVVFLALVPLLGLGGAALFAALPGATGAAAALGGCVGVGLAWPASSLPIYYWRSQARTYARAMVG